MNTEPTKAQKIAGIVLTILPSLMLLMSAGFKLAGAKEAVDGFAKMGFPAGALMPIGVAELVSTILFLVPKTSFLGAILLTGYLGGAVCTHVLVGDSFLIPFALGVVVWVGYGLRRPGVIKSAF